MNFPIVIQRELTVRARHWTTFRNRTVAALIAVMIATVMLLIGDLFSAMRTVGTAMYHTMAWLAFFFCVFQGLSATIDCISSEKREGTLGLLFLTELSGFDVMMGKLIANSVDCFYRLLAIFPALAIPFVVGGITGGEFWRMLLSLLNTLFFSLCLGILVSVLGKQERRVWGMGLALTIFIILFVPVPDLIRATGNFTQLSPLFSLASPLLAFLVSGDESFRALPGNYWSGLFFSHLLGWLLMIVAGYLAGARWREQTQVGEFSRFDRLLEFNFLQRSSGAKVAAEQTRDKNPILWLARIEGGKWPFVALSLAGCAILGIVCWQTKMDRNAVAAIFVAFFWLLRWMLRIWVAAQSVYAMANLRSSGLMELTLVAPLTPVRILTSYATAMRDFFLPLAACLGTMEIIAMVVWMAKSPGADQAALIILIGWMVSAAIMALDLNAVMWTGFWNGLTNAKTNRAITRTISHVMVLPLLVVILFPLMLFFCGIGIPLFFIVKSVMFGNIMHDRLKTRLREAAAQEYTGDSQPPWYWPFGRSRKPPVVPPPLPPMPPMNPT